MKLVKRLLSFLLVIITTVLLLVFVTRYINASSIIGILTPLSIGYHLAISVSVVLGLSILFIARNKYAIVCSLIIGVLFFVDANKTFGSTSETIDSDDLTILSYNTRLLNYYNWTNRSNVRRDIIGKIHYESPDIMCFQEFFTPKKETDYNTLDTLKLLFPDYHVSSKFQTQPKTGKRFGLLTFSRFRVISQSNIEFDNDHTNGVLITQMETDEGDTLVVANCHLGSIRFEKIDLADTSQWNSDVTQSRWKRLRNASIKRENQVLALIDHVQKTVQSSNLIVVADLNDTPYSKSYHYLKNIMQDSFEKASVGVYSSYNQFPFPLRIDFVFGSQGINFKKYEQRRWELSDHEPILTHFSL